MILISDIFSLQGDYICKVHKEVCTISRTESDNIMSSNDSDVQKICALAGLCTGGVDNLADFVLSKKLVDASYKLCPKQFTELIAGN